MTAFQRKSVNQLINGNSKGKYTFFIPAFQRGYKWTPSEVSKLMSDIWEFKQKPKSNNEDAFYCLQPIVVRSVDGKYHVIDGQQRLTTLLIIQQAIRDYNAFSTKECVDDAKVELELKDCTLNTSTYSIDYETRGSSKEWLATRYKPESMRINSDFYHIYYAYKTALEFLAEIDDCDENILVKWIKQKDGASSLPDDARHGIKKETEACSAFSKCMKDKCDVIWYEFQPDGKTDEEVFDRLNTGKISLNNAELIKALFLQKDNYPHLKDTDVKSEDYRTHIAREWDMFEHQLQNPVFWHFIYDKDTVGMTYESRIEYILDLISGKDKKDSDRFYYTFDYYNALFKSYKKPIDFVNEQWKIIRELMQTLQDWFDNRTYYHYIGYLISQGHSVNEIKEIQFPVDEDGKALPIPTKKEFISKLEERIRCQTQKYKSKDLFKGKAGLTPVLLLFNVLTELSSPNENARFPFHHYKQTTWNEEHVAPATPFEPDNPKRCFLFAAEMLEYYTDISYYAELDSLSKRESSKPKDKQKNASKLKEEARYNVLQKYRTFIPGMGDDKEICEKLLKIFEKKGEDVKDLSQECFDAIGRQFSTSTNQLDEHDSEERDFIWNQVLLDEGTNKSYGNAIFPYKRKRIIKNASQGIFVPIGTQNVFVKAYSYQLQHMFEWDKTDATRYLAEIFRVLNQDGRNFLDVESFWKEDGLPSFVCTETIKKQSGYESE